MSAESRETHAENVSKEHKNQHNCRGGFKAERGKILIRYYNFISTGKRFMNLPSRNDKYQLNTIKAGLQLKTVTLRYLMKSDALQKCV